MSLEFMLIALMSSVSMSTPTLTPCTLAHPSGGRIPARCGSVETDATTRAGAPVTVGYAVLKATGSKPSTTPLVLLAGGPGQAATRDFVPLLPLLQGLRASRDLILVDVRGTGRSTPVHCKDDRPLAARLADNGDDDSALRACMSTLPIDPAKLTTQDNVADLERVRIALGVERWYVLGVSYGTRLAVAYDAAHRGHVAGLVLDGVAPLDRPLGADIGIDMTASLTALGADVVAAYKTVHERLKAAPQLLSLRHPTTGAPLELTVTADLVAAAVRLFLYADETRAILGHALQTAENGDLMPIAALAVLTASSVDDAIHVPVNLATICAEDTPFVVDPPETLLGSDMAAMRRACATFTPAKRAPLSFAATPTPTLLVSGEHDPITPPRHAERTLALFPNGRHFVVKGMGHNVLPRGCVATVVDDALAAIDLGEGLEQLDAHCLTRLDAFPAFIDALGPSP